MDIDLPQEMTEQIEDICRKTKKDRQDVIISLLGLALMAAPYNDLVTRYVQLLNDPEQGRWADVIATVLERTVPAN